MQTDSSNNKYFFFEDSSKSDRRLTVSLFTIVIICVAVVIHVVPMPTRTGMSQSLESLVLESVAIAVNAPEQIDSGEETKEEAETSLEDFDELLSSFMNEIPAEVMSTDTELSASETNRSLLRTDVDVDFGVSEEKEFGTGLADLFSQVERREGTSLQPTLESRFVSSSEPGFVTNVVDISDNLASRRGSPADLEILESVYSGIDRSTLTPEEAAREDAVVLWMKESSGNWLKLEPAIGTLLDSGPTDLVFSDDILLNGEEFTIKLTYSPVNRTLKIVLIQGNSLHYFIDPGLQNRANYFKTGHVVRDGDNKVVMVESEEKSVQSTDAIRIFDQFLSWWANEIKVPL